MNTNAAKLRKEQYETCLINQKWKAIANLKDINDAWMIEEAYQITKKPYRKSRKRRF